MRLEALDSPGQRTLRELLAAGHKSYLGLLWGDAVVESSGDDQSLYDRAGERVALDLAALTQPPDVGALLADLRARAPGASEEVLKSSAVGLGRMRRRLALARTLLSQHAPDFSLIRIDETDLLAHHYWDALDTAEPGLPPAPPDPQGAILERTYQLVDEELIALLQAMSPEDDLLVFSDHGMRSQVEHDTTCLFIADGPSYRDGARIRLSSRQLLSVFVATLGLTPPAKVPPDLFRRP